MILPLHHCSAIGCMVLLDPGELMCVPHWSQVKPETKSLLKAAVTPIQQFEAELLARGDVLTVSLSKPDASQANSKTPVSPSAAGSEEQTP